DFVGASTSELGKVACRLYRIWINAAAIKCLWSCMDFLQMDQ
ncbi:45482_t:CDS:1, partial [Gigaspora margarita]